MTAKLDARMTTGLSRVPFDFWEIVLRVARRFPRRVRERRFWHVQALVVLATVPHYAVESSGGAFATLESWQLNSLAISLYILPLLYASLNYSWEGAVLTALWAAALTSPSIWYWGRSEPHWVTEMGQLMVVLPVGLLVAWRIDKEAVLRRRAETTSKHLALLNEIGERLSRTLEVERQLPGILRRLLAALPFESVWVCLEPESQDLPPRILAEVSDARAPRPEERARRLHALFASSPEATAADSRTAVIPLVGESGSLGSLGGTVAGGEALRAEYMELLSTVAQEIRVAVENARLYRERQEALQSYARQVTEAQEEERLRIARELHDETAQELVHLVRKLEQVGERAGPALASSVDELLSIARETLRSVRRFSRDLRPPVLDDLGLLPALEMVVDEADSRLPEGAQLKVSGESRRLASPVELALFRIAQEGLRNVEKHSSATAATVELRFDDRSIRLSVSDNGLGFAAPKRLSGLAHLGKLGLLGMKERAELAGGRFELHSSPGDGTRLVVHINGGGRTSS